MPPTTPSRDTARRPGRAAPNRRSALAALAALPALATAPMAAHAIEEPAYTVERKLSDHVELRAYAPYVVAEVFVEAASGDAGNAAFPILAGYIFGKNKGERKMAMTAPVTQSPEPMKMAMTAPVTRSPAPGGGHRVQFVLPSSVSLAEAPEPLDPRVQLRQVPAHRLAVLQYRGSWSESVYAERLAELEATLGRAGLRWEGEPVFARFDPPLTPWFLRRNEIWLRLAEAP